MKSHPVFITVSLSGLPGRMSQVRRAFVEPLFHCIVEPPYGLETRGKCDIRHRECCFIDQFPGEIQAAGQGDGMGGSAQVSFEQAAQLAVAHAQGVSQLGDVMLIQVPVIDQLEGVGDGG